MGGWVRWEIRDTETDRQRERSSSQPTHPPTHLRTHPLHLGAHGHAAPALDTLIRIEINRIIRRLHPPTLSFLGKGKRRRGGLAVSGLSNPPPTTIPFVVVLERLADLGRSNVLDLERGGWVGGWEGGWE